MRTIQLTSVVIENFRSINSAAVSFPATPGFRFMSGENKAEPDLGANGAGKSSLWEAIFWCLFGVSMRGLKASDLVTWGADQIRVALLISIDGTEALIVRHSSPNKIWVNGELTEQAEIHQIIGMERNRFQHSVMFGQGVKLFPDLALPDRANLLDELLDLNVWTRLTERAARKLAGLEGELTSCEYSIASAKGVLEAISETEITELEQAAYDWTHDNKAIRRIAHHKLQQLDNEYHNALEEVDAARTALDQFEAYDTATLDDLKDKLLTIDQDMGKWRTIASQAFKLCEFYREHADCPTCRVSLTERFREEAIREQRKLRAQAQTAFDILVKKRALIEAQINGEHRLKAKHDQRYQELSSHRRNEQARASNLEQQVIEARAAYQLARDAENPYTAQLDRMLKLHDKARRDLASLNKSKFKLKGQMAVGEYWRGGFRRVRLYQIRRSLDALAVQVGNSAQALGLKDWRINFATETETKSGTSKLGVQIIIESPTGGKGVWDAWSGGEAQRIRLAVALGMSSFIQELSGVRWLTEVYDEPSAWLSSEGQEDLLETLSQRSTANQSCIYVCDHRALTFAGFSEIWQATKTSEGTTYGVL